MEKCWDPFPYKDEDHEEFAADLAQLWKETEAKIDEKTQIILMTHEGPYGSSTAQNVYFDRDGIDVTTYHTGDKSLRELMLANQHRVVCNIHGHSHDGSFIQNIGQPCQVLPVINPGSLGQGEFAELKITKTQQGKWKVTSATK